MEYIRLISVSGWTLFAVALSGAPAFAAANNAVSISQEVVPPTEPSDIKVIVKTVKDAVSGAYALGARPAMRDAHAKGHGCVKSTFTVWANIPKALKTGLFATPHIYTAWIRFSNGAGTPHDDAAGDGRGMAIKLLGVAGPKLLAEEHDGQTQDFVMINYPVFFIRNVADYVPFTQLSLVGKSREFFARHPHESAISKAITSQSVPQVFEERYFSMAPYLFGSQYVKFSARPVDCSTGRPIANFKQTVPATAANYLRKGMIDWLGKKDACFNFSVQTQTDSSAQPVEDPTILWNEKAAPYTDVASIRILQQRFDSAAQQNFCENLSYTPWHSLAAQRPVGGINRLRKAVYEAVSALRHNLNKTTRSEPKGNESFN